MCFLSWGISQLNKSVDFSFSLVSTIPHPLQLNPLPVVNCGLPVPVTQDPLGTEGGAG